MLDRPETLDEQVQRCHGEMKQRLDQLSREYTPIVMLAACGEHVGGALSLFIEDELCTREQARDVLNRCERIAFGRTTEDGPPNTVINPPTSPTNT